MTGTPKTPFTLRPVAFRSTALSKRRAKFFLTRVNGSCDKGLHKLYGLGTLEVNLPRVIARSRFA